MRVLLVVLAAAVACCERPAPPGTSMREESTPAWFRDRSPVHSITAHAFRNPSTQPVSLLRDGAVDLSRLDASTTAEVSPDLPARNALLAAMLDSHPPVARSDCYIPHHLFVLRDHAGSIMGAMEVCFSCRAVKTLPPTPRELTPDWRLLAEWCTAQQLGLGPNFDSIADFEASLEDASP